MLGAGPIDIALADRRNGGIAYGSGGGAWGSKSCEGGGAGLGRRCGGTGIAPLTVAGCCCWTSEEASSLDDENECRCGRGAGPWEGGIRLAPSLPIGNGIIGRRDDDDALEAVPARLRLDMCADRDEPPPDMLDAGRPSSSSPYTLDRPIELLADALAWCRPRYGRPSGAAPGRRLGGRLDSVAGGEGPDGSGSNCPGPPYDPSRGNAG